MIAPFTAETFKDAFGSKGAKELNCGVNFFSHKIEYSARAKIPMIRENIIQIMNSDFREPAGTKLVIAIPGANYDLDKHHGSWYAVSPDEDRIAMVLAIARDCKEAAKDKRKAWEKILLSTPATIVIAEDEDARYDLATNLREKISDDFANKAITTFQRIEEIYVFKAGYLEKNAITTCASKTIAAEYNKRIKVSKKASEPVNDSFCEMAISIHEKAFIHKQVFDIMMKLEGKHVAHPLSRIHVLFAFVSRGKTKENIIWAFEAMYDHLQSKEMKMDEIAVRSMTGTKDQRGIVDLLTIQREFKEYLLGVSLIELGVEEQICDQLRHVFKDHTNYRALVKALPDQPAANIDYQVGYDPCILDYMEMVQDRNEHAKCCYI